MSQLAIILVFLLFPIALGRLLQDILLHPRESAKSSCIKSHPLQCHSCTMPSSVDIIGAASKAFSVQVKRLTHVFMNAFDSVCIDSLAYCIHCFVVALLSELCLADRQDGKLWSLRLTCLIVCCRCAFNMSSGLHAQTDIPSPKAWASAMTPDLRVFM